MLLAGPLQYWGAGKSEDILNITSTRKLEHFNYLYLPFYKTSLHLKRVLYIFNSHECHHFRHLRQLLERKREGGRS